MPVAAAAMSRATEVAGIAVRRGFADRSIFSREFTCRHGAIP